MKIDQIVTLVSSILLTLITLYYSVINHKIMSFSKKVYEMGKRPYINFNGIVCKYYSNQNTGITSLQLGIALKNISKILVKYNFITFNVVIGRNTIYEPKFFSKEGYLYPEQETQFHYEAFENVDTTKQIEGKIDYEIEYFFEERRKYRTMRSMVFTIFQDQKWEYRFLEEKEVEL